MKTLLRIILIAALISLFLPTCVFAEGDLAAELLDEVVSSVESGEIEFGGVVDGVEKGRYFDFKNIIDSTAEFLFGEMSRSVSSLIRLVAAAVISGILCSMSTKKEAGGTAEVSFFACYCALAAMVVNSFYELLSFSHATIDSLRIFMQSLIPALMAVISAGGAVSVASAVPPLFTAMQIITALSQSVFLPLIFTITALSIVNNLSVRFHITKLIELLRQILKWSLGLLMTVYVGLLGLQGISSAFFDGITGKTVKYALCNFVPVVGGVLADSASAVIFSVGLVKNTVGIAGIVVLILMCAAPLAKISAIGIMYRLAAGICEPVAEKRVVSMFSDVASSITQIFAILLMVCVMFIISIAILCMASGASVLAR